MIGTTVVARLVSSLRRWSAGWPTVGRQRRVANALTIDTPTGIAEERLVRIGGID